MESPYGDEGEGEVEMGGGSEERLVLGHARQQPLFVSSFLVSPEVTFGGHDIVVACQVAIQGRGRGGGRKPSSEGTCIHRRVARPSCRRCACRLGKSGRLSTAKKVHLG